MIDPHRFAEWVSAEAQACFAASASDAAPPSDIDGLRLHYDAYNCRLLDAALALYPVDIVRSDLGGVAVDIVTAVGGATDSRTLISLHGGAFMWGAGAGALLEAVPLAAVTGCTVVAVDYRLAPEHVFPAAVDDVVAVYRALLADREASTIGVYGCSAGGALTAQTVARLAREGIAVPGAVAMLHGTGLEFVGDSAAAASAFDPRGGDSEPPTTGELPYFSTTAPDDPLAYPGNHPDVLAHFPPSLLISGSRDFAASACSVMHRRLLAAGVDAQLILFDGMWHAHHMAVALPESQETFALLHRFFDEKLQ